MAHVSDLLNIPGVDRKTSFPMNILMRTKLKQVLKVFILIIILSGMVFQCCNLKPLVLKLTLSHPWHYREL